MAAALATTTSIPSSSTSSPSTWSDLPDELLHSIILRLSQVRHLLAFASVCRSWRSVATSTSSTSIFPPLLIRPLLHYRPRRRRRFPVSALQLCDLDIPPVLAHNHLNRSPIEESVLSLPFLSSSHGHLLFLSRQNQILIFNFITGRRITSPVLPIDCFQLRCSHLAQLTGPISSQSCTLILLTYHCLFMWKINSLDWISCHLQVFLLSLRQMVVVGSKIWILESTLNSENKLSLIDLPEDLGSKVCVVQYPGWRYAFPDLLNPRLVDCGGEVLCVCFNSYNLEKEVQVEVFGFDLYGKNLLVKKNSIGNRAIFMSSALNVPGCVCNDPERWGGKANCIYYKCTNKQTWSVLEVGHFVPRSLLDIKSNRATCSFPFWEFASILQRLVTVKHCSRR